MGTNYYVTGPGTELTELTESGPGLHIGKKSFGWDFLFRGHPDLGLTTVAKWREFVSQPGREIISEYHAIEDVDEFFKMATERPADAQRRGARLRPHADETYFRQDRRYYHIDRDARGCPFMDGEFC